MSFESNGVTLRKTSWYSRRLDIPESFYLENIFSGDKNNLVVGCYVYVKCICFVMFYKIAIKNTDQ